MKADTRSGAAPEQRGADDEGLLLTGRMMHVSRLATIGEMASGIAHELNQPLTAIANYAEASARMLDAPDPDLPEVRQALREVASQAVRAGQIIQRMRSLVRHNEAERITVHLNALITELTELIETDARIHDTRLRVELAQRLPRVSVDRVQMQHVVLNLVRNALEALSEVPAQQREIEIRTALAADGGVELTISDSGRGVARDVIDRMFEPFYTTKPAGTGLGLPISNTIVRAHQGTFRYRPGVPSGACFAVCLPAAQEPG